MLPVKFINISENDMLVTKHDTRKETYPYPTSICLYQRIGREERLPNNTLVLFSHCNEHNAVILFLQLCLVFSLYKVSEYVTYSSSQWKCSFSI